MRTIKEGIKGDASIIEIIIDARMEVHPIVVGAGNAMCTKKDHVIRSRTNRKERALSKNRHINYCPKVPLSKSEIARLTI